MFVTLDSFAMGVCSHRLANAEICAWESVQGERNFITAIDFNNDNQTGWTIVSSTIIAVSCSVQLRRGVLDRGWVGALYGLGLGTIISAYISRGAIDLSWPSCCHQIFRRIISW